MLPAGIQLNIWEKTGRGKNALSSAATSTCSFINSQRWGINLLFPLEPLSLPSGGLSLGERGCSCNFSRWVGLFFPGKCEVELRDGFMAGAGAKPSSGLGGRSCEGSVLKQSRLVSPSKDSALVRKIPSAGNAGDGVAQAHVRLSQGWDLDSDDPRGSLPAGDIPWFYDFLVLWGVGTPPCPIRGNH